MKIILIEPRAVSQAFHSGLGYIASNLDKGHVIKVYDLNFLDWSKEQLLQKIKEEEPDIVGISMKSRNVKNAINLGKAIKKVTGAILVCGGPHITLCGRNFFEKENEKLFKFGLAGEAEISFNQLCQSIREKTSHTDIPGLIYFQNEQWHCNRPEFLTDLNKLKHPEFEVFEGIDVPIQSYPLLTSRGCPYLCIYCSVGKVSGRRWRFRSPANIMEELILASKKYQMKEFEIIDDNFTLNAERVNKFCLLLIESKLDLRWSCPNGIRADKINPKMVELMRKSGCYEVSLGIESGNEEVFNKIKKGETLQDVEKAIKILKNAKIKVNGFFIIGLPGDSIEATKDSLRFIEKVQLKGTKWNFLIPYPQTELWESLKESGQFLKDFTQGQHFSRNNKPIVSIFDTPDFSTKDRIKAYKLANLVTGNYRYVFKIPENKLYFYIKLICYLLYYSPETLYKKIFNKIKKV